MRFTLVALGTLTMVLTVVFGNLPQAADASTGPIPLNCNRACLENVVDQYLAALVAHDPKRAPISADVKYTENNQVIQIGDGFWKTVEACEAECNRRVDKLCAMFKAMPDERLKETKWLPYDGGRDFTMAEMMDYPRWNFSYHQGQIAYIQTLYGDKEMH